jgi:hypothetical protein
MIEFNHGLWIMDYELEQDGGGVGKAVPIREFSHDTSDNQRFE